MLFRTSILLCFYLCFFQQLQGQIFLDKDNANISSNVSNSDIPELLNTIETAFHDYEKYASLRDDITGEVNEESVAKFKNLFQNNATITNDIGPFSGDDINYSDYASNVLNHLNTIGGVKFKLSKAKLKSIEFDAGEGGIYKAVVKTEKEISVGLDGKRVPVYYSPTKKITINIYYDIPKSNIQQAKILNIKKTGGKKGGNRKIKREGRKYLFLLPSYRYNSHKDFESASSIGGDIGYQINDKLAVLAGIYYNRKDITSSTESDDTFTNVELIEGKENQQDVLVSRHFSIDSYVDMVKVTSFQIPIKLRYNFLNFNKISVFGELALVPEFNRSIIQDSTIIQSELDYMTIGFKQFKESYTETLRIDDVNSNEFANSVYKNDKGITPLEINETKLLLSAMIGAGILYDINNNLGVVVSADYTFGLNNIFESIPEEANDSYQIPTIVHKKYSDNKLNYFGIRFGLQLSF